ncbi:hypothetical protein Ddye_031136 [Dipteronia dyeriana]|uniref:CLAVATA3/ESR (CLE)-related protein 25 n=1 Tax=Dipteronia dyeriana TaxID=168575 RepID=A0AAD9TIX1_9ROSI|nr:hypothetical protein Ddye_031132 [Dipteronia dyeriana]KAK2636344.1 hypothetical protein Ddye_031136 [Dipteronia dyeriana]
MGGRSSSSRSYNMLKGLFGGVAVVGFMWLLLVGAAVESGGGNKEMTTSAAAAEAFTRSQTQQSSTSSTGNLNRVEMDSLGREKHLNAPELDLNYMSKRRVPNGPDPIHNRRAGNSRRPPGQS